MSEVYRVDDVVRGQNGRGTSQVMSQKMTIGKVAVLRADIAGAASLANARTVPTILSTSPLADSRGRGHKRPEQPKRPARQPLPTPAPTRRRSAPPTARSGQAPARRHHMQLRSTATPATATID